jgi:hypothetical protein
VLNVIIIEKKSNVGQNGPPTKAKVRSSAMKEYSSSADRSHPPWSLSPDQAKRIIWSQIQYIQIRQKESSEVKFGIFRSGKGIIAQSNIVCRDQVTKQSANTLIIYSQKCKNRVGSFKIFFSRTKVSSVMLGSKKLEIRKKWELAVGWKPNRVPWNLAKSVEG